MHGHGHLKLVELAKVALLPRVAHGPEPAEIARHRPGLVTHEVEKADRQPSVGEAARRNALRVVLELLV